jgi:hypothetical protein
MDSDSKRYDFGTVTDESERERLRLIYEGRTYEDKECGYDFHSLIWEHSENGIWKLRKELTQETFEAECINQRWISKLHSFDPKTGYAVLQVAEGDAPKGSHEIHYNYSWRKWDLNNNREVAFIHQCKDPFEPYDPSANSS